MTKKPDDGPDHILTTPGEVERRYSGAGLDRAAPGETLGDLGSMTRAERAAKYERDMKPYVDAQLEADRGALVRKYRANPKAWPDGIDDDGDRWYLAEEWNHLGEYIGEEPCVRPANPDQVPINTPADKSVKLAAARGALAAVEGKLGVKPVDVTKTVGASVTKTDVTKTYVTDPDAFIKAITEGGAKVVVIDTLSQLSAEPKKGGRPKKDVTLSPAERKRAQRAKLKGEKEKSS